METNSVESLTEKIARLRDTVAAAQAEIEEIETLLRLAEKYRLNPGPAEITAAATARALAALELAPRMTIKERILTAAESVLLDGKRRVSRELMADMAKLGVVVGGGDPAANLASYLSREKDIFESDVKAGGWTLKRLTKKAKADSVGALSAFSSTFDLA